MLICWRDGSGCDDCMSYTGLNPPGSSCKLRLLHHQGPLLAENKHLLSASLGTTALLCLRPAQESVLPAS